MEETKTDKIFNFVFTWLLMRVPLMFFICYGLYQDFKSSGLSYFAGIVILMLLVIIDKLVKIIESKESKK